MRRFRIRRRRALAIALVPAAALTISTSSSAAGAEQPQAAIDPAKPAVRFGHRVTLRGQFPGAPGQAVAILYRRANGERFEQVRATRTDRNSRWSVRVKPQGTGMWRARLSSAPRSAEPGEGLLEQPTAVDSETGAKGGRVNVYRKAQASWYGPGFHGNRTACGQTFTSGMLGVAHKTLPHGTKLKLRHGSRTVKVKVIDRGPYAGDREFDLTEATRNKLDFGNTGTVLTTK